MEPDGLRRAGLHRDGLERIIDVFRAGNPERLDEPDAGLGQGAVDDRLLTAQFEGFVEGMYAAVVRFAGRLAGSDVAEDVASETFTVAWRRWSSAPVEPQARRAWVFGIARNRALHQRDDQARRWRLTARLRATSRHDVSPEPDAGLVATAAVMALLRPLPADQREAMLLTVVGGLSCAEAAGVAGCSVTAMTTRLSRARSRLRAVLSEPVEEVNGL